MDEAHGRRRFWGYSLVSLAIVVFSTIEVASQYLQKDQGVSALDMSLLRFGIGGVVLALASCLKTGFGRYLEIAKNDGSKIALMGLIGTTALSLCYHRSLMLTSSMIGGAIFSINPAVVAGIFVITRVEKLRWSKVLGIVLGMACVIVTNIGAKAHEPQFPNYSLGNLLMILAVLSWSLYFFLIRDYLIRYGALIVSSIAVVSGSIGLILTMPILPSIGWGETLTFHEHLTPLGWVIVLYLGIVTVGLGYYWLYTGLAITGISNGMMLFFMKPIIVALLAHLLQGQELSMTIWFGVLLAASSVAIVGLRN